MFIVESDEIDKLYLPAHSNHRHNVHKQLRCICTQCYRGVTHQGQHVVIYTRGGKLLQGRRVLYFPGTPWMPGKKSRDYMEWQGHKSYNTSRYI